LSRIDGDFWLSKKLKSTVIIGLKKARSQRNTIIAVA
jgi:hypothetical protein